MKDVTGDSFVIAAKGEPVLLPVKQAAVKLKIEQSLKLSGVSAVVNDLKGERVYSVGNDPRMVRQKQMMAVTAALDDEASLAMGKYTYAQNKFGVALNSSAGTGSAESAAGLDAAAEAAGNAAFQANQMATALQSSNRTSGTYYRGKAKEDVALEMFDAMEVSFEVSSQTPLNNPYVMVVSRFRERNARPESARNWIYAKSLEPIGSEPCKVTIRQSGFPRGFILEAYRVHLYNRGQEVATNVSTKRLPLTREEAFDYLKIEYFSEHKGDTLPAAPAMAQLPEDFHKRLSGGKLNQTLYVKVTKDGLAGEAFTDESCSQRVDDPYVDAVVKGVRFKPALEKGKPVDTVAALKLGDLSI